jgi:hypothetical protein
MLRDLGVTLIAADSPSSFLDDGPISKLIRQILGAVSEFDSPSSRVPATALGGFRASAKAGRPTRSGKVGKS